MNLRILFATDLHFRATKPVSRLDDDFFQHQLDKLDQIRLISENVDLVILGGDIFDRPDAPRSVSIKVARVLKKFDKPVYTVIGNHDIYGYSGSTIDVTAIGELMEHKVLHRLDFLRPDDKIRVYGVHAFDKDNWRVPDEPGVTKIIVAHKMLTDMPIPGAGCLLISDVAQQTNADIILSGDIHTPHTVTENGVLFINPGSMSRMSITDRERYPQVALLSVTDEGTTVEHEILDSRPAEAVFDLKSYSNRLAQESHTKGYAKIYAEAIVSVRGESHKIGDQLIRFLEENGVEDKMRGTLMNYLERAQQEVLQEAPE